MCVVVEEPPEFVFEFWEFSLVWVSFVELAVVVQDVDCFFFEQFGYFWVAVNHLSEIGFLEVRVEGLISQSGVKQHGWEQSVKFESEAEMGELVEEEGCEGQDVELEGVVHSLSPFVI